MLKASRTKCYASRRRPIRHIEVFAISDVTLHIGEAEHVLNLLASERPII